jgi:nitroreductase
MPVDAMDLLLTRDSALRLEPPGPDAAALDEIFRAALRAPDHGRLRPWRFIVIPEERRQRFGDVLADSLKKREPNTSPESLARERQKALRAPVIVVVAAQIKPSDKIPELEQIVSAGAAAQNVMLAAHALGYGAMWRTGAPAYDAGVKAALDLQPNDTIIGFIYIGTRAGGSAPVSRPVPEDFVGVWRG